MKINNLFLCNDNILVNFCVYENNYAIFMHCLFGIHLSRHYMLTNCNAIWEMIKSWDFFKNRDTCKILFVSILFKYQNVMEIEVINNCFAYYIHLQSLFLYVLGDKILDIYIKDPYHSTHIYYILSFNFFVNFEDKALNTFKMFINLFKIWINKTQCLLFVSLDISTIL